MQVRVMHTLGRLAADERSAATEVERRSPGVVKDAADYGRDLARALARANAGPHGKHFYKRINSEMTGATEAEFGPDGTPKTEFVGVGFRTGGGNRDLEQAAEPAAVSLAADVRDMLRKVLW